MRMSTPFSIKRLVTFAETDMAGIAHFSNYFRWMEEVEHAFFRARGLSVAMTHENIEIGWPRVNVGCEYYKPVKFEDELELRLRVTKVGGKSLSKEKEKQQNEKHEAQRKSTNECCEHT